MTRFNFFCVVFNGEPGACRSNLTADGDDDVRVWGTASDPNALTFYGN
ncbi:MAG: hypothetical protein GTN62_02330 [Gemmatimonadales bacterium]|nr:hypothetical protein [Gemmatimonadales bacterium]NIN10791.1 hypothetical protein [Gemmatimonadales bacterium]NIN48937.1 hypothetical protein [Gemmatimonadales bacterium]NIP06401.1 hypothetical protein [Gemmatimonadales bacterium]NIR00212.1 hypothetical protein [Gemmatimonadales bacterium]